MDETIKKQYQLAEDDAEIARQRQLDEYNFNRTYKQAQIDNIYADNELNKEKIKDIKDWRTQSLEQRKQIAEEKAQNTALAKIYSGLYFDPANPAHRQMAVQAKLDPDKMPKVDLRRPFEKTVGDTTYVWNSETRKFEDSGIEKQKNLSLVDYTVVDPNTGVESTYTTTSEKAAGLKQSFANAGMQIKAASERQQKQLDATAIENEKRRRFSAEQFAKARAMAQERIDIAKQNLAIAQQRLANAEAKDKRAAEMEVKKWKKSLLGLKSFLMSNEYTRDNADLLLQFDELEQ